jgi:MFS family permease
MLFASLFTYAADYVPAARRTQGLAIFGVSGMLPISLGGLLGDWLLSHYDYAALFLVAFGFAVIALLLSLPLRDEPHESGAREPSRAFLEVLTQRDLVPLWFVGAVFSVALAAVFVFVKLFVEETGLGSVGLFFTSYTAVALVFRVFFGWLPDRIGPKRVLFPALATLTLGFVMLALAADPTTRPRCRARRGHVDLHRALRRRGPGRGPAVRVDLWTTPAAGDSVLGSVRRAHPLRAALCRGGPDPGGG